MPYDAPSPSDLRARYPAFSDTAVISDATIQYWLTDAKRFVDESWMEADYAPALIAHAAYEMAQRQVPGITGSDIAGLAASGLTDFQSGAFSARFSADAVKVAVAGGYAANIYGMEYAELLMRNKTGPRVTGGGDFPCGYAYNGWAGPMPPYLGAL